MKNIENGTEVLIFKKNWLDNTCDKKTFIRGIIINCELSDDLSQHGSPWYENIYTVLGEDGNTYKGTYGSGFFGNCVFITPEDHIAYLKHQISFNNDKIDALNKENSEYVRMINAVTNEKEENNKLLLSKEQLDKIKTSDIFKQWLTGLVDENDLNEEEKKLIYAYQVYYGLMLSDDFISGVLDHLRCCSIDELLGDESLIEIASIMYNVSKEDIRIRALLAKKRMGKEKVLIRTTKF